MKERWNRQTHTHKRLRIVQLIFSIITILAAISQLTGLWKDANILTVPSLGIVVLAQAILDRKVNRVTSLLGFLAAIAVFVMYGIGIFLP